VRFVKIHVTEKGQWARELAVEVEAARIDSAVNKALRRYQKRLEIPGFRKGKVPLRIVEARFGSSIRGEVLGDLLPSLLEEATREAGLRPAAPPKISQLDHDPGGSLTFTADLDIWPEIKAEHYENLAATRMVHEVADEEIGEHLEELRRRHATEQVVERPLAKGDVLVADLQRLDESGLPVIGDKYEKRHILIGDENALSPEFEEALVGMDAGEERKVRFAYREDLPNEQLAGQIAHFAVAAHEVRERTLPELDDEFAKDLGEQFQTLDDFWDRWAQASDPPMTPKIFEPSVTAHFERFTKWLEKPPGDRPLTVAADSRTEAVAFIACLFRHHDVPATARYHAVVFESAGTLRTLSGSPSPFIPIVYDDDIEREIAAH